MRESAIMSAPAEANASRTEGWAHVTLPTAATWAPCEWQRS